MSKMILMVHSICKGCDMDLSFDFETCKEVEPCPYCGEEVETGVSDSDD